LRRLVRVCSCALIGAFLAAASGCGKPVLRIADASLGDYYTEEEFKKLSKEQRQEYCAELARQDSAYKAEIAETREALDALKLHGQSLRAEGDSLLQLAAAQQAAISAEREARSETGAGVEASARALTHVVRPGESLWRISRSPQGYGRGDHWGRIYEANKDRIADPNLIHPGQELSIPR
jgi:nucleoid-associated protein YgaU